MKNKWITGALAAATLALCGQAFAQADKTGRVPNINPNLPEEPAQQMKPQADTGSTHQKKHHSHAKKSKSSKKNPQSQSDGASPSAAGDTVAPNE